MVLGYVPLFESFVSFQIVINIRGDKGHYKLRHTLFPGNRKEAIGTDIPPGTPLPPIYRQISVGVRWCYKNSPHHGNLPLKNSEQENI